MAAASGGCKYRVFVEALIGDIGIDLNTGQVIRAFRKGLLRHEVDLEPGSAQGDRLTAGELIDRLPTGAVGFLTVAAEGRLVFVHIQGNPRIRSRISTTLHKFKHRDRRNLCILHTADKQAPIIDRTHIGVVDAAKGTGSGSRHRGFVHQTDILDGIVCIVGAVPADQCYNIRVIREIMIDDIVGRCRTGQLLFSKCQCLFRAEPIFIRVSGLTQIHTYRLNLTDVFIHVVILGQLLTLVIKVKVRVLGVIFIHAVEVHGFALSVKMPQGDIAIRSDAHILGNGKIRFDGIAHRGIVGYIKGRPMVAFVGIDI